MLGLPNCIRNQVKAWDFVLSEVIHKGKTHMLIKKSRATNSTISHFELFTDFVLFLLFCYRSVDSVSTRSLTFVGHMIRFESRQTVNFKRSTDV